MEFAGAGFGEDLNVAESDPFEFGGKWILIDHNLANGLLIGQYGTGREAINEHLRAAGSGGRASQSAQLGGEFVRIVGEHVKIFPTNRARTFVAVGIGTQRSHVVDCDSLFFDRDRQLKIFGVDTR